MDNGKNGPIFRPAPCPVAMGQNLGQEFVKAHFMVEIPVLNPNCPRNLSHVGDKIVHAF